jgi:hypothetical protein
MLGWEKQKQTTDSEYLFKRKCINSNLNGASLQLTYNLKTLTFSIFQFQNYLSDLSNIFKNSSKIKYENVTDASPHSISIKKIL